MFIFLNPAGGGALFDLPSCLCETPKVLAFGVCTAP